MTDGQEYLTFPGPDNYKIQWSCGTRRYKLVRAPSGHLISTCDSYKEYKEQDKKGGVRTPVTTLCSQQGQSQAPQVLPTRPTDNPQVPQTSE